MSCPHMIGYWEQTRPCRSREAGLTCHRRWQTGQREQALCRWLQATRNRFFCFEQAL